MASSKPRLVERYISYYGDGAVLDCDRSPGGLKRDDEGPTAIVRVVMPKSDYLDIWHYCRRDNNGPNPMNDAYEAAGAVATTAVEWEVEECGACEQIAALGVKTRCYLCGRET